MVRNQRLYIIKSQQKLPEIGGIRGPVLKPMALTEKTVISLLNRGVSIYEVNPANYRDTTRVTFRNVHTKPYSQAYASTKKPTSSSSKETYNVYDRVANTYGKSVRGGNASTAAGSSDNTLASQSGKPYKGELPKGRKTTVVEQSSEAATVSAEKAEKLKAEMNKGKDTTEESTSTSAKTAVKSSDF